MIKPFSRAHAAVARASRNSPRLAGL